MRRLELTELDAEVVEALAVCGLNVARVARKMRYHRNSIIYHVSKIKKITGLDPEDFYGLQELLKAKDEWKGGD